jgi:hypothetical protein
MFIEFSVAFRMERIRWQARMAAPRRLLRHGRAWRVALDAILTMPIPPHGLRWLSILSKPRFVPLQTAVC